MREDVPLELKSGNYIINLDDSTGPGTHWTCLIKNNNIYFYFDSMGVIAPARICELYKPLIYNRQQIQDINSSACGYYCIFFIKYMNIKNKNLLDIYKDFNYLFSNNTLYNDRILKKLMTRSLP